MHNKNKLIMKKKLIITLLSVFLLSSCFAQDKVTRDVDDFTAVSFGVAGEMILVQGDQFKVELKGDEDLLDIIETTVKNDRLYIKKENWRFRSNGRVTVYVTMKEIDGLSVSGSGVLHTDGPIDCDELDLSVSGSGKLDINKLSADVIDCSISGSGNIYVSGSGADSGEVSISGSGKFDGVGFEVEDMEIGISGSGNCKVNVTGALNARVSGSGDVYYTGDAPRIDARVSGSGKVRKL